MKPSAAPQSRQQQASNFTKPLSGASPLPLHRNDAIGLAALSAVLLLLSYLQSRHKMYWGDEIMGRYVLDAGSWHLFLERWRTGIDSSGFWFYVFAKPWEWIFGRSELALRMFSAAGVITAAALVWITARRFYTFTVVAIAVPFIFLDIAVLRWQLANGRCYGVFLSSTALVIFLMLRPESGSPAPTGPSLLVVTFLAYDILAGSHILGMLYAGSLLAIQMGLDLQARRWRPLLYLSAAAGIVAIVIFSFANIRSTTALGKPVFWTATPSFHDLFLLTDLTGSAVKPALLALALITLLSLRRSRQRDPVYVFLLGFLLLNFLLFAISRFSTSIYIDRYLTPFFAALILLCAELLTQLGDLTPLQARLASAIPPLIVLWGLYEAPRLPASFYPKADFTKSFLAALPPSTAVVDTDVASFVDMEFYYHGRFARPFLFPLDAGVAADPHNPDGVSGFHEMDNFARLGLDMPDLQPTDDILARYPDLLVITADEKPTAWLRLRLLDSPNYEVTKLGPLTGEHPLILWRARRLRSPALR